MTTNKPTRKLKPKRWSRKGQCPSCGVSGGSRHSKNCDFNYDIYNLSIQEVKERIKREVGITEETQNAGVNWTPDYKKGSIDGLKRSLELFSSKN